MGVVALVIRILGWFFELAGPGYLGMYLGASNFNAPGDLWVRAFVYANLGGLLLWVASRIDGKRKKALAPTDHSEYQAVGANMGAAAVGGPDPIARTAPEQPARQGPGYQQIPESASYFRFCSKCGRPRTSTEKFCNGCGASLAADSSGLRGS